ncbi:BnaC01g30270D [Brassica napus]|uniref:BnaC01g30270D protein n=1 Tax=Brassica napus TaxID=3708 RepID=A0A078IAT3_BRANA|nr:BnaC01g30270D [Brassica napus]
MAMKYHRKISALHLQIYSRCLLLLKPPPKREAKAHEVYQNLLRTEAEARVVNGTGAELDQIRPDKKLAKEDMSDHERGMEKTTDHLHRQTVNSKKNYLAWRSKLGQQLQLLRQLKTQAISRLKTQMMLIAYASQGHQPPEANGSHKTVSVTNIFLCVHVYVNYELMLPGKFVLYREDDISSLWWKEYADCSQGSLPQVVPKNKLNKQLIDTHLETFVSSTLYEVEEERVGVPKTDLNFVWTFFCHVWRRRRFQPYGFLASHVDLQILQSLFTGEDDTWKSWLKAVIPAVLNLQWPRTAELKSRICRDAKL